MFPCSTHSAHGRFLHNRVSLQRFLSSVASVQPRNTLYVSRISLFEIKIRNETDDFEITNKKSQTVRETDKVWKTNRQTNKQTNIQTNKQTSTQTKSKQERELARIVDGVLSQLQCL